MRWSGFVVDSDTDSVNTLYTLIDDAYEMGGETERWETILGDGAPLTSQGSSRDLLLPLQSNMRSMRALWANVDTTTLISPPDESKNKSLSAHLIHDEFDAKSSSNNSGSTSSFKKEIRGRKRSMRKAKPKLLRKGTKMSLFDFDDADLSGLDTSDEEQSNTSSKASIDDKNIPTTGALKNDKAQREGRDKMSVELPDLGH